MNPQPMQVDFGINTKPKPVKFNVTKVEVVALLTKISTIFNIIDGISYF